MPNFIRLPPESLPNVGFCTADVQLQPHLTNNNIAQQKFAFPERLQHKFDKKIEKNV